MIIVDIKVHLGQFNQNLYFYCVATECCSYSSACKNYDTDIHCQLRVRTLTLAMCYLQSVTHKALCVCAEFSLYINLFVAALHK